MAAEAIGVASGALALAVFAFKSSVSLYQTVGSFQSSKREIRELKEELKSLQQVIEPLEMLASADEVRFNGLCLPLLCCGKACKEFDELIAKCTKHSKESKTSFRDWATLQYKSKDMVGFKNLLAGYKATISIAIGDINLRTTSVTAAAVQEFKVLLENTKADLTQDLEWFQEQLKALRILDRDTKDQHTAKMDRIAQEMESIKACLTVCVQASKHIETMRSNVFEDISAAQHAYQVIASTLGEVISAKRVTAESGAIQILTQTSDATLLQLARSRGIDLSCHEGPARRDGEEAEGNVGFSDRYGGGRKLG